MEVFIFSMNNTLLEIWQIFYNFESFYNESMHCFDESEEEVEQEVGLEDENVDDIDNVSDIIYLPRSLSAFVREQYVWTGWDRHARCLDLDL